ncbi:MAG: diguanylate cyclase [Treponema sp.]|nr:diguanylate cyclase [Treponema sp.]
MTPYFAALTCINIITLVMLIIDFIGNTIITPFQKGNLVATCIMILFICISEVFATILDGADVKYRFYHILVNFVGFSFVPGIYYTLMRAMFPKKNKFFNIFLAIWIAFDIFMLVCLFTGTEHGIIYVDKNNNYSRGKEFFFFIIVYSFGTICFFFENLYISLRFWKRTNIMLIIDFLFILFATFVQIIFPGIQVSWTCIIISITMYYLYFESLYQQMDTQTYLLNYTSLKTWKKHQKKTVLIVVAELDNYSKLKINYSRDQINTILETIAKLFHSYYKKYGRCYRIGSEEFCVVIPSTGIDIETLNKEFFIDIVKYNFETADMPLISIGYSEMTPYTDIAQALSLADAKKRIFIKERLKFLY